MKEYTLITGGSGGIGFELAKIALRNKRNIVLVSQNSKKLSSAILDLQKLNKHGADIKKLVCDLSSPDAAQAVFKFCKENGLYVNKLINNAGFGDYGPFSGSSLDVQRSMINLNILCLTELTHLFLPTMQKRKDGKIMNLGSVASFLPGPNMSVYYASKNFVLSFSRALSEELRGSGVSVTCLCPGPTRTGFAKIARVGKRNVIATSKVTAQDVAEFGWHAMQHAEPVAVYGLGNRFSVQFAKFIPRNLLPRLVKKFQR